MPNANLFRSMTLLLVDDEPANLHVLKHILQSEYRLLFAKDGQEALNIALEMLPDLILLDVRLPIMNGYEVCRALKQDSRTARIPVIFVTTMSDVIDEAHGFEVGGVDYILKPVSPAIVKARVNTQLALMQELKKALETEQILRHTNVELEAYKKFSEYELFMARELMEHMIQKSSTQVKSVEIWLQAATNLSGDMIITQDYCNERSYIILADAMGHGLPAALPLMPIVQVFSSMAQKGFTVSAIIREMNLRVIDMTPAGNFVAVTLLSIDHKNRFIEIWNGGNPDARVYNITGETIKIFASQHPALGMAREGNFNPSTEMFHWNEQCWLTLFSDGLTEAQNSQGEYFGEDRIITFLKGNQPHLTLKNAILEYLNNQDARDDISIATILLDVKD